MMESNILTHECVTVRMYYKDINSKHNIIMNRTILMKDDKVDLEKSIKIIKKCFIKEMKGKGEILKDKDITIIDIYQQAVVNYLEK